MLFVETGIIQKRYIFVFFFSKKQVYRFLCCGFAINPHTDFVTLFKIKIVLMSFQHPRNLKREIAVVVVHTEHADRGGRTAIPIYLNIHIIITHTIVSQRIQRGSLKLHRQYVSQRCVTTNNKKSVSTLYNTTHTKKKRISSSLYYYSRFKKVYLIFFEKNKFLRC